MSTLPAFALESLSYSGRLVNTNGSPVTGSVTIRAELAYTNSLASILCTDDVAGVTLTNGVFHVKLDFDCTDSGASPGRTLTQVLSQAPAGQSVAIQITDMTHSKSYSFQALHALPFANVASQLAQNGAGDGEFLKWSNSAKGWVPGTVSGATGGTVTNVSVSAPLTIASPTSTPSITLPQASEAQSGYLSSADWTTFNNKEGTIAGGTATQYYRGDKSWQTLDSSVVPENVNLYFTNARALGVPLTGFSATSSAIVATDTVIQGISKAQGQINTLSSDSTHFLKKDNTDSITGTVNVGVTGSLTITNAPALPTDAANRQYVNTYADTKLALTGGTLSGVLTLDSDLKIKGGSNYVTVRGHATSAAYNFILPSSAGTSGQFLQTDGSGNLSWVAQSSTATPSGAAGGDLAGTYPNPTVPGLANKISTTLTSGNVLVGNGSNVATGVAVSGDATLSNTGVLTLANTAVTAGTYKSVTVDGKGRVTGGTNPTTLAGYGITDTLVTGVSVSAPITNTGTAAVPLIGMPAATGAADGYLTSANFNTFNNKQAAITSASTLNTGSLTSNLQGGLVINPYNTAAGNTGEIRFNELAASGSNFIAFKAPDALAGNVVYTLPTTDGTSGQVLTTNAAGVLSWSSHPTTAAPSGSAGGDLTGSYPNPTVANGLVATKISTGVVDNTEYNYLDGVTSAIQTQLNGKQASDATLTSLAAYNTNGILVQTAADTFVGRSLVGTANRLSVTSGDGVSGNPTLNISTALLPSPVAGDAGKFLKASGADTSAWTALSSSDVTTALGYTPINKAGDTMATGTFNYNGTALLRTLDPVGPTDVATKQYVDSYGQWTKNASDIHYSAGKVGIGINTPLNELHVQSTAGASVRITGDSDLDTPSLLLLETPALASSSGFEMKFDGSNGAGGNRLDFISHIAGTPSPRFSILRDNGHVGIGITNPQVKLHLGGDSDLSVDGVTPILITRSTTYPPANQETAGLAYISESSSSSTTMWPPQGSISFIPTENHSATNKGTAIVLSTTPNGSTARTQRMAIDHNGLVGIGTTTPGRLLHVVRAADDALSGDVALAQFDRKAVSGTPAAGIASFLQMGLPNSSNSVVLAGDIGAKLTDVTPGSEKGILIFRTTVAGGASEKVRIDHTGNVGIGNSNPKAKLEVNGGAVIGNGQGGKTIGVASYFTSTNSTALYIHIKTPFRPQFDTGMYHFKVEGYAYADSKDIDLTYVGYSYPPNYPSINNAQSRDPQGLFAPAQYLGSDGYIYLRFKPANTYYLTIRVDSTYVGNGRVIYPGEMTITESAAATL